MKDTAEIDACSTCDAHCLPSSNDTDEARKNTEARTGVGTEQIVQEPPIRPANVEGRRSEAQATAEGVIGAHHDHSLFFDNAPLGCFTLNCDGVIQDVNLAGARQFRLSKQEFVGTPLVQLVAPAHVAVFRTFVEQSGGGRSNESCEIELLRANGPSWHARLERFVVPDPRGQSPRIGLMISDITARILDGERIRQLSVAVEQSPASVVITDTRGSIEYVNPRFTEVTGYRSEEVIGCNPRILKGGKRPRESYRRLWKTILGGKIWTGAFENKKKNGELYWEEASICPIRNAQGTVTHFLAVKQDITRRKRIEDALRRTESELRQHRDHLEDIVQDRTRELGLVNRSLVREIEVRREAEEAARAATKAKSQFLATMSHELRTPLNGIIGMTDVLLKSGLTPEQKQHAGLVKAAGDTLLNLINDVLDYSKIEAGRLELEVADFELRECIEYIGLLLGPQAEEKGLELTVGVDPAVPDTLRGDAGRLQQVLTNLVSNAIKFTATGQVVVRARVDEATASTVSIRIAVTDTGIGIPPAKQALLFQSFSQVDASHSRRFGGTGLGLAISKQLVEMMGGEIGAVSKVNSGSTFWFTLTLEKGQGVGEPSPVPAEWRDVRILVVAHHPANREILHKQLTALEISHELAPSAEAALSRLRQASASENAFSLAMIDMSPPHIDGAQLAAVIKGDRGIRDTELLLLASPSVLRDEARMRALGFSAWLPKPTRQSHLLSAIAHALGYARDDMIPNPSAADRRKPNTRRQSATSGARILAAEDNEIGREVLRRVLTMAGYPFEIAENGRRAVDLWRTGKFDLVLMDTQMPELDGFQATCAIRRAEKERATGDQAPPRIPIIALTANALTSDREECIRAGMDEHVAKPFDPEHLIEAIELQIARTEKRK